MYNGAMSSGGAAYLSYGDLTKDKNIYLNNYYVCTYEYGPQNSVIGNGSVTPRSSYCQVFNSQDCANEWTERCQMIANDRTMIPNLANPLKNSVENLNNSKGAGTVGDNLILETARNKYCKYLSRDMNGKYTDKVTFQKEIVLGANVEWDVYKPVADTMFCVAPSAEAIENDPVIIQLLDRDIGYDVIMNIYRNTKRMNIDISKTALYKKAKVLESYGF